MPSVTRQSEQADRIRDALLDLCYERGFANLTIEDLCDRAGVARAEFDASYEDLEDCLVKVYEAEFALYRRQAEAARAGLEEWSDRLRATAYALYRFLAESPQRHHFHMIEVRAGGERVNRIQGQGVEEMFDLIDEGRSEPGAPADLTRATAEQVGGGIFNQMFFAARAGGHMPPEEEIVPRLMYTAVLPYLGVQRATQELTMAPPERVMGT